MSCRQNKLKNLSLLVIAFIGLLYVVSVPPVIAQQNSNNNSESPWGVSIKPSILSSINKDKYAPGILFDITYEKEKATVEIIDDNVDNKKNNENKYVKYLSTAIYGNLKGALASNSEVNSNPIRLSLTYGRDCLYQPRGSAGRIDPKMKKRLRSAITIALNSSLESDQSQGNQLASIGTYLSFRNNTNAGLYTFFPSIRFNFDVAKDLSSEVAQRYGSQNESFVRGRAEVSWKFILSNFFGLARTWMDNSVVLARINACKEFDRNQSWNDEGFDEALYGSITFSLGNPWNTKYIDKDAFFITLSTGREPPVLENSTTLIVGVKLNWSEISKALFE